MATIRERRGSGGKTSHAVLFRHNGRQRSITFTDRPAAVHFVKMIDVLGVDAALEQATTPADALTLDELAELYWPYAARRHRSDRTVADYKRDYSNWISPTLGHRAAAAITEADIQALVDDMHGRLEPKSIVDRHALLYGIFKYGSSTSRRLVPDNPCTGTELPKRLRKQPKGLRPAEWQALYPALEQIDRDGADLALFLLATGWRFSEAAALSKFDTEDDGERIVVSMGQVLRRNAAGEHVIVQDGKSDAAMRRITLDRDASAMVRRRVTQLHDADLVFTTKNGAQWHSSNFNARIWKPAVKAAGLTRQPTPHWLRHTSVAWLVMSGQVSLPEIQRRLGHENIATTIDVYGRMIQDVSPAALDAFEAMRQPSRQIGQ